MKILKDFKNDLLQRKEVKMVVEAEKNPSYEEAMKILANQFKAIEDVIVIDTIQGKFGRKTFLITAKIYDSKEAKEKIEPKPKKKEGEESKPTEQPAVAPAAQPKPEEKPAEEVPKEEKPEENKEKEKKEE